MILPSQHIALLLDQAEYFRRMGNHPGEVASLKAAERLGEGGLWRSGLTGRIKKGWEK